MRDDYFVDRLHALEDYLDKFYNVGKGNEIINMYLTIEFAPEKPLIPLSAEKSIAIIK